MDHHVDGFSVRGAQRKERCDRYIACSYEGVSTIALSDGATACARASRAAEIAVHAAAFFVTEYFHRLLDAEEEQAAYSICSHVLGAVTKEAVNNDIPLEEYGCTLLVYAYDACSGQTMQFHLGDGGIVQVKKNGQSVVLSRPHNRGWNVTDLITSENVFSCVRFRKGQLTEPCTVFLLSDGCWNLKEVCRSAKQFEQIVRRCAPEDDATCVSLTFTDTPDDG